MVAHESKNYLCRIKPLYVLAILVTIFSCTTIWAAQTALVIVDRAVIYADEHMTSPIGYVKRGKKIKVGEKAKNLGQVYAIVVSKKVAYIKVNDLSTEKEDADSERLVAERFQKATTRSYKSNTSVMLYMYNSTVELSKENGDLKNKEAVTWTGLSLKGGVEAGKRWDIELIFNYMNAQEGEEVFRAVEAGGGFALRVFEKSRFMVRLTAQLLFVPFATYALADLFRVNGYGVSMGGGINGIYRLTDRWGIEAFGGIYYTKLMGFNPPADYESFDPVFVGSRIGLGANYQF